jgi:hypothetical protein
MSKPLQAKKPNLHYAYFDYEVSAINSARNVRDGFEDVIIADNIVTTEMAPFWLREGVDHLKEALLEPAIKNLRQYFDGTLDAEGKTIKIVFPYRLATAWHWNAAEFVFTKTDDDNWSFRGSKYDPYGLKSDLEDEVCQAVKEKFEEVFEDLEFNQKNYNDLEFNGAQFGGVACGMYAAFMLHKLKTRTFTNQTALNTIWEDLSQTEEQQRQADLDLVGLYKPELLAQFGQIDESGFVSYEKYLPKSSEKTKSAPKSLLSLKKPQKILSKEAEDLLDCVVRICAKLNKESLDLLLNGKSDSILGNALNAYDNNKKVNAGLAKKFERIATYLSISIDKIKGEELEIFNQRLIYIAESIYKERLERSRFRDIKAKEQLTKKLEHLAATPITSKDLETHLKEYGLYDQGQYGETILHWAVFGGNYKLVDLLIKKDPKLIRHCDSDKKRTPICWAAKNLLKFKSLKEAEVLKLLNIVELISGYCDEELLNSKDGDGNSFLDYFEQFNILVGGKKTKTSAQYLLKIDEIKKSLSDRKPLETEVSFADLVVDWRSSLDVDIELDDGSRMILDGDQIHRQLKYVENTFRSQLKSHKLKKSESVTAKKEQSSESKIKQGFDVILGDPKTRTKTHKTSIFDARREVLKKSIKDGSFREAMKQALQLKKEEKEEKLIKMFEEECSTHDATIDKFRESLTPEKRLVFLNMGSESSKKIGLKAHKEAISGAQKLLSASSSKVSPSKKEDGDEEDDEENSEVKVANFVPAHLTFVVSLGAENRVIKIPVVFDNHTNVYNVYDLWSGHFTTASTRNSLAEESLKLRTKAEDFKGDIDSKYKHSEQALIDLLDNTLFAQKTFKKIILAITGNRKLADLMATPDSSRNRIMIDLLEKNASLRDEFKVSLDGLEKIKSLKISYAVLDIHSYRYMCRDCSISLHHWSNPNEAQYGFINNLDNHIQSSLGGFEKRQRTSSQAKVIVRTSTDKEFKQKPKTADDHVVERVAVEKGKPLTMRVISRDTRDDKDIVPGLNPKRRVSKYSIATSGGKTENKQEYQMAYNQASEGEVKRAVRLIEEGWLNYKGV